MAEEKVLEEKAKKEKKKEEKKVQPLIENNFWVEGYNIPVGDFVEMKNGLGYLGNNKAWELVKEKFGDDFGYKARPCTYVKMIDGKEIEREEPYFIDNDKNFGFVIIDCWLKGYGPEGSDLKHTCWQYIDDNRGYILPADKITEEDIHNTEVRVLTKAIAELTGIGYSLWLDWDEKGNFKQKHIEPLNFDWQGKDLKKSFSILKGLNLISEDEIKQLAFKDNADYVAIHAMVRALKTILPRSTFGTLFNFNDSGLLVPYDERMLGVKTNSFLTLRIPNGYNEKGEMTYLEKGYEADRVLDRKGASFGKEVHTNTQRTTCKIIAKETGIGWDVYSKSLDVNKRIAANQEVYDFVNKWLEDGKTGLKPMAEKDLITMNKLENASQITDEMRQEWLNLTLQALILQDYKIPESDYYAKQGKDKNFKEKMFELLKNNGFNVDEYNKVRKAKKEQVQEQRNSKELS